MYAEITELDMMVLKVNIIRKAIKVTNEVVSVHASVAFVGSTLRLI